jgi:acetyltransferase-like isoleucine patch superfamily enzyme/dTDP-4-dehydrorhamnose 3,5-epimerase-like enzyme
LKTDLHRDAMPATANPHRHVLRQLNRSAAPSSALAARPRVDPLAHIDPAVELPPDVVIRSGAYLPAGVWLGAGCEIGPNVAFIDGAPTCVKRGVRIGANATVHAGVTLCAGAVVQPGAVVTRSVPAGAIVEGNPAVIVGYVDAARGVSPTALPQRATALTKTPVRGVTLHQFPVIPDLRGNLTVGEFSSQIPFEPQRYFLVYGVPSREVRGEHAHRQCQQFLICLQGSCAVVADDGQHRTEVLLDAPHRGLYLPPMTWGIQYQYSADAMLLVFASHRYDAADYIRDYDDFLAECIGIAA